MLFLLASSQAAAHADYLHTPILVSVFLPATGSCSGSPRNSSVERCIVTPATATAVLRQFISTCQLSLLHCTAPSLELPADQNPLRYLKAFRDRNRSTAQHCYLEPGNLVSAIPFRPPHIPPAKFVTGSLPSSSLSSDLHPGLHHILFIRLPKQKPPTCSVHRERTSQSTETTSPTQLHLPPLRPGATASRRTSIALAESSRTL